MAKLRREPVYRHQKSDISWISIKKAVFRKSIET